MQLLPVTSKTPGETRTRVLMGIGVASLLSVLLVPRVLGHLQRVEIANTEQTMSTTIDAIEQFARGHYGRYPTSQEITGVLSIVVADPGAETTGQNHDTAPVDAWGNELLYWCPGTFNRESYDLSSAGPDGVFGNSDDITNWD